jgi:hypothetical protein
MTTIEEKYRAKYGATREADDPISQEIQDELEYADMMTWATGTQEEKARIAIKHLGNRLQGGRADWDRNAIMIGETQIFPTRPMIAKWENRLREELGKEAEKFPALGPAVRAGASIPIAESAQRKYLETQAGELVKTPAGEVALTPEGPRRTDEPPRLGQAVLMTAMPALTWAAPIVAELIDPGTIRETISDVADIAGPAIEVAPQAAATALATRGGAGALGRAAIEGAGGAVGTLARRAVSEAIQPGEDIGLGETAMAAGTAAGMGAGAELATSGAARALTAPRRMAIESMTGRGLSSKAETEALDTVMREMGVELDPALLSLSEQGALMTRMLRRMPGGADAWMRKDVQNILVQNRFLDRYIDAQLGKAGANLDRTVNSVAAAVTKQDQLLRKQQLKMFSDAMDSAQSKVVGRQLEFGNLLDTIQDLEVNSGLDMSKFIRDLDKYQNVDGAPRMSIAEMQRKLSDFGKGIAPDFTSDAGVKHHVMGRLKGALLDDLRTAAENPAFAGAAQDLLKARHTYHVMQAEIDTQKTRLARKILGLKKDQGLENLPSELLGKKFSDRQVKLLGKTLGKLAPRTKQRLVREMWNEALSKAGVTRTTLRGKQVAEAARALEEPQLARRPAAVAKIIDDIKPRLELLHGAPLDELDRIQDGFERLSLIDEALRQSPTAPLLAADKLIKSAHNLILNPGESLPELAVYGYRKRLTAAMTNPNGSQALATMVNPPKDADARTISNALQTLMGVISRDRLLFGEDEQPGPLGVSQ